MLADREEWLSLKEILERVQLEHGLVVQRTNLSSRVLAGPNGRETMLERLQRLGLARTVQRGKRQDWEVSTAAIEQLAERASGRPGPASGAQVTLSADQVLEFARQITSAGSADAIAVMDALKTATGLPKDKLDEVERIVIPRAPRQTR